MGPPGESAKPTDVIEVLILRRGRTPATVRALFNGRMAWQASTKGVYRSVDTTPAIVEALAAHFDLFLDAGWPMDSWFLRPCPACPAGAFYACENKRTGRQLKRCHLARTAVE